MVDPTGIAIAVTSVFVLIMIGHFFKRKAHKVWKEAANHLGLDSQPGSWGQNTEISGTHRGRRLRSYIRTAGQSSNNDTYRYDAPWTIVEILLEGEHWQGVTLNPRFLRAWLAKYGSDTDIEIGDPAFDEEFRLQGMVGERLEEVLQKPSIQGALRGLQSGFGRFLITEGCLEVHNQGKIYDTSRMVRLLEQAVDYAIILDPLSTDSDREPPLDKVAAFEDTPPVQSDALW